MANLSTLRTRLAARFATITAIRMSYATMPDQVVTPCAVVMPTGAAWREALGGSPSFSFEVWLLVAPWADRGLPRAQALLDAYLDDTGSQSVHAALRADVTLAGAAHTCNLDGFTEYGALDVGGTEYLGCKLLVTVWA